MNEILMRPAVEAALSEDAKRELVAFTRAEADRGSPSEYRASYDGFQRRWASEANTAGCASVRD
jgi:hypothetical protein